MTTVTCLVYLVFRNEEEKLLISKERFLERNLKVECASEYPGLAVLSTTRFLPTFLTLFLSSLLVFASLPSFQPKRAALQPDAGLVQATPVPESGLGSHSVLLP